MSFFSGGFGDVVGGIAGLAGGLIGGHQDRNFARAQSEADRNFQREVFQNQYQWKAEDARKAGLHPLAVIGGGSYSASPSSVPASSMAGTLSDSLGKLGEGIGDTFTAYMNRDQIAEAKARSEAEWNKKMEALDAQIGEIRARTQESINRAMSYTKPLATGSELMAGQVDSGDKPSPVVRSHPSYEVRDMGNGLYDINFTQEYQQTIGDELGQLVNFYHQGKRHLGSRWRDPLTGIVYYRVPEEGYWVRGHEVGYSNNRQTAYGHLRLY